MRGVVRECGTIPACDQAQLVDPDVLGGDIVAAVSAIGVEQAIETVGELKLRP